MAARSPHRGRCVPVPAHPRRGRPAPVRRGPARTALGGARRAPAVVHHRRRRRRRRVVRGVGAECQGRQPDRRLQPAGTATRRRCGCWGPPGCGSCSGPASRPTACTSSGSTAPTAASSDHADPMAFATEVPPHTASRVTSSSHVWDDGDWMAQRAAKNPVFEPMSTYEVHLGSWRPGLSYRQTGRPAHRVRCGHWASPTSRLLPVAEHPFGGSWGYQVTSYYAPIVALRHSRRLPVPGRPAAPGRHRRDRRLGAGPLPQGRVGAGPLRRHPALRARRPAPRRATRTGAPTFSTSAAREVRNFLVANALYWLQELPHRRPAGRRRRLDALPGLLAPADGWTPNIYGGRENLEAVQFLQEMNATVHKIAPGIVTIAEESTSWPGVTRPTNLGGLGFSIKWNMGWMHDTLDYISRDPIYRNYHHHEMTFSMLYAFSENFVLPISHDEVVHGKGTLWGRMPGNDHWQGRRPARPAGLSVGPPRQAAAVHGPGVRPARRVVARNAASTGISSTSTASPRASSDGARHQRHLPRPAGAVEPGHQARGLLLDRRQRLRQQRAELPALRQRRLGDGVRVQLLRRRAQPVPARPAARGPVARDPQHRRHRLRRRRASATWAGSNATDEPWHGRPASVELALPPTSALWLVPE